MVDHISHSWYWVIDSHSFRSLSINPLIPQIRLFQTLTLKLQGQGHGWGQRSRSHSSPSIQTMHFLLVSHQSDQPFLRYDQYSVWHWKDTSEISKENLAKKKSFQAWPEGYSYQVLQWLSGSYFIWQTSKFLFINVIAVTFGQGHQKVIQYIFPDLYFLCAKYASFTSNGFDVRSKSLCSVGGVGRGRGRGRGGGNELKT